jgi:pimeloyl-ACP methyl ester carboxylesterase
MTDPRTVDVKGIELAYRVQGRPDAPPVLLLHGLGSDGADWAEVADALSATHRVYALDARGHGGSEWPGTPGAYALERMRDDTLAFLDVLGLARVALIGHSMGGAVGYLLAAHAPGRLSALILEDAPTPDPADPPREIPQGPEPGEPYDWRAVAATLAWRNAPDPAWWQLFPAVTCRTLVIGGGPTSHLPQHRLALAADRMPDARMVTIDAGHQVHAARPAEFLAEVRAFLRGVPGPSGD